jgi:hypothetical protein
MIRYKHFKKYNNEMTVVLLRDSTWNEYRLDTHLVDAEGERIYEGDELVLVRDDSFVYKVIYEMGGFWWCGSGLWDYVEEGSNVCRGLIHYKEGTNETSR